VKLGARSGELEQELTSSLLNMDMEAVKRIVRENLEHGGDAQHLLSILMNGMRMVGSRFESQEFFLADLIMAGEIMKQATAIIKPHLSASRQTSAGTVVLGTIAGDLHDIGKDIVKSILFSEGFDVHDLGTDVVPARFVQKARESGSEVIGVSALLTTTIPRVKEVVDELEKVGIRHDVRVIIGGAAVREKDVALYGVDAAVNDAIEGVRIIKSWTRGASTK